MSNTYNEKEIQVNSTCFSYFETEGCQGIPWLLLHGTRDNKLVWEGVLSEFAGKNHMIALDLRGHGKSEKTDCEYSYDLFIEDILNFIKTLGFDKINILGHSLGGAIGMYFTVKNPDLVNKLGLFGSLASDRLDFKPDVRGKSHAEIINELCRFFFPKQRKVVPSAIVEYVEKQITSGWVNNITPVTHKRLNELKRVNLTEYLKDIKAETLLVYGELDGVAKVSSGRQIHEKMENSSFHIIEDTGHFFFLERPDEVYTILGAFLKDRD